MVHQRSGPFLTSVSMPKRLRTMTTDQTSATAVPPRTTPAFEWGDGFALQAAQGNASPRRCGHFSGTGCAGWIDLEYSITIAFVSNVHANRGRDEWLEHMEEAIDVSIAALTTLEK